MRIMIASIATAITLASSIAASAAPVNIQCEMGSFADRFWCESRLGGN